MNMSSSLFRRERYRSLSHRRLAQGRCRWCTVYKHSSVQVLVNSTRDAAMPRFSSSSSICTRSRHRCPTRRKTA